ncbi:1-acyl-sn-glycerol-3-phosphate acyltransferase [Mycoplasmatota bacterium]|nr:1-acyl-sn-glycerol-3-phosphate acyltransferase [Mycoplasmatota bacterium]
MKKTLRDKISDVMLFVLKPFVYIWMKIDTKTKVYNHGVNFRRKEPFVLLGNHVYTFDVVKLAFSWKITPVIVASHLLLTVPPLKILLKYIAKCVPKSKGEADLRTAKSLIRAVKKGYPIMIMPEGDSTFFGETGYVEKSTAKLIKKLKLDVIVGLFKGGYLAKPRWALGKRHNRRVELHYKRIISKEEISNLTVDEIYKIMCKELYNNDYDWQRNIMNKYPGKELAEGFTNVIYACSECRSLNTLATFGNTIKCKHCNTEGFMDDYGFIHGFTYDNMRDWNKFQLAEADRLRKSNFRTTGLLFHVDFDNERRELVGEVTLEYGDGLYIIDGALKKEFKADELIYPVITMRRNFSFEVDGVYYLIKLEDYAMSFLRACQDKY